MENGTAKSTNNTKETFERKPSIKGRKAPPAVRQTLTSYKRMLKANPLLKYQEAGVDIDQMLKSTENFSMESSKGVLDGRPSLREFKKPEIKPLVRTQSLKLPRTSRVELVNNKPTIISGNKPNTNTNFKRPILNAKVSKSKPDIPGLKQLPESKQLKTHLAPKTNNIAGPGTSRQCPTSSNNIANKPKLPPKKDVKIKRRSLSTGHIKSKSGVTFDPRDAYTIANRSRSHENLNNELRVVANVNVTDFSPILEESSRNLVFKTPSAYERRSVCRFTPQSARRSSLFQSSTPAPVEMKRLQERLNQWLKSRGKPLASFHHLRCFDIETGEKASAQATNDEENKENIEIALERTESYDNLNIDTPNLPIEVTKKTPITDEELVKAAKEAMVELHKLIEEDYPSGQCLGWLELIRGKYEKAVDDPKYWECRAAIEQSFGNVGNAVEYYKTAIIQGAEVTSVDKSLDQLLKKFSLLNITPDKSKQTNGNAHKERIVKEARNVFKSTIIQFAIQERKLKKNNESTIQNSKKLIVTPVRRSTRLSRSGFVNTTGVKLCTSLKEINLSEDEIDFEKNTALC